MHTQCPHCQTVFRVNAAHLNVAQGHVRCSHCRSVFNATSHLVREPTHQRFGSAAVLDDHLVLADTELADYFPEEAALAAPQSSWSKLLFWSFISLILMALLAGQLLWFWHRDQVLQHPQLRPWLVRFCHTFLCTLPPTRAVEQIQMQQHVAQLSPQNQEVIQFDAVLVNTASFPQPYPQLQLTFENNSGIAIAQRRFKPREYLSEPFAEQLMPPDIPIHIQLELVDMGQMVENEHIVKGYTFKFL